MRRRSLTAILLLCFSAAPVRAQLRAVDTPELRLVYIDPSETYLIPHAVRTFLNSIAFQRRVFGFESKRPVAVLLVDFQDAGNAGATVVPYNELTIQIAPLSFAFETIAGNERLNIIMNHELVHVATMDRAAPRDSAFRRFFGGKVMPHAEQPESILYFFLTTPRVAAPRWYHEGIAVFTDTWMAGGLGRAQGGYDEMVFRSMVRDGVAFYDPLGLVSEGTKIDFQTEVNSYLYGTRFMTWLARTYSPEQLVSWVSRREGTRAYYSADFRREFGTPLESAWSNWVKDEHTFQQKNLEAIRTYPVTTGTDITPRALGSVSRAYYDAASQTIYAGVNYPGAASHVAAISVATGRVDRIVDIKGPSIYTVTSLTYDPGSRTIFYTADNGAYRDVMSVNPATHRTRMLLKDARIGDLAFDKADGSLWGIRTLNGICSLVRIPRPVLRMGARGHVAVRHHRVRRRRVRGRHPHSGVVRHDRRQAGSARVLDRRGAGRKRRRARREIRLRQFGAERLHLRSRRPVSLRHVVPTRARPTSSGTISNRKSSTPSPTPTPGSSDPSPSAATR